MKFLWICLINLSLVIVSNAQILNADRLGTKVDSVHTFKALFDIGFNIQKQVDIILSLDTKVDLSYYYKQSLFVLIGNFKLFRSGLVNILNGGYAHTRLRFAQHNWIHPEFFGQFQADQIRGMEQRGLGGGNLRFIIKEYDKGHLNFGLGLMYEYEHWNFSAVPSTIIILDKTPIHNHYIKLNAYLSYTQTIKELLTFQITAYFQSRPDSYFIAPRLSVTGSTTINFTKNISFAIFYNIYYDSAPPVPIDKLFFTITNKLVFTF